MSKIINGGLSSHDIFVVVLLSVVGDHHIMPILQDEYDITPGQTYDEVEAAVASLLQHGIGVHE